MHFYIRGQLLTHRDLNIYQTSYKKNAYHLSLMTYNFRLSMLSNRILNIISHHLVFLQIIFQYSNLYFSKSQSWTFIILEPLHIIAIGVKI